MNSDGSVMNCNGVLGVLGSTESPDLAAVIRGRLEQLAHKWCLLADLQCRLQDSGSGLVGAGRTGQDVRRMEGKRVQCRIVTVRSRGADRRKSVDCEIEGGSLRRAGEEVVCLTGDGYW